MRYIWIVLLLFTFSKMTFGQGGYSYPGNFEFKPFTDETRAYNFSGIDVFFGRNTSVKRSKNFFFFKNAINNWGYLKLTPKYRLYTQIQRGDEFFLKDPALGRGVLNSLSEGFRWHPDTIINLNGSRFGIIGYQDFGSWFEWETDSKITFAGIRIRDYSNIYTIGIDTASISNKYTSSLNTGSEYVAFAQGNQTFLSSNALNLNLLQTDPIKLVSTAIAPRNYLILIDYSEKHRINDKHEFETSLIGIPIISRLGDLLSRKVQIDWRYSGLDLSRLNQIVDLPGLDVRKDSNVTVVPSQLNTRKNLFKPAQEIHIGWTYIPRQTLRYTVKYSAFSNHLFNNTNVAFGMYQNHGKNLQIFTRLNFSSQFGNWNEIGFLFKPVPRVTIFSNLSGTDIIRFRETIQIKTNFKIVHLNVGFFANL